MLAACRHADLTNAAVSPGACCPLDGRWDIAITLDSAGQLTRQPGTELRGQLQFSPKFKPPKWKASPRSADMVKEQRRQMEKLEFGRFQIDFSPFWDNGPFGPVPSTMRLSDWPDPLSDVLGLVIGNDTVGLMLNPQFTHGGLVLAGRFMGDSVVFGKWFVRGDRSGIGGRFRMRRERHS